MGSKWVYEGFSVTVIGIYWSRICLYFLQCHGRTNTGCSAGWSNGNFARERGWFASGRSRI